jgi:transcriptional regulator with XRE-family HTH domain
MPSDTDRERIAAEVRAELARQGKTQRQAAELLGMTQQALQMRLAGSRSFRAEEIALLAEKLGVPVGRFLISPTAASAA